MSWAQRLAQPLLPTSKPLEEEEWECMGFEAKAPPKPNPWEHAKASGFKPAGWGTVNLMAGAPAAGGGRPANESWVDMASRKQTQELMAKRHRLLLAICASMAVMLTELVGGSLAHSLALASDATHMLADVAGYCIALVAVQAAMPARADDAASFLDGCGPQESVRRRLNKRASFGLHRVPVLGGLGSILVIWLAAGVLLYEGVARVAATLWPSEGDPVVTIDGVTMIVVATLGLLLNGAILYIFRDLGHGHGGGGGSAGGGGGGASPSAGSHHGHSHGSSDVTTQAAMIHAVGDMIQSVGMLATACLIALGGQRWALLDALVTCGCSLYMLSGTLSLLKEVFYVLIEAAPPTLDARAVRTALRERPEVLAIRDFHVWALAPGKVMLSAVVLTTPKCDDTDDVLVDLQKVCQYKFDLHHCTFQVTRDPRLA